MESEDIMFYAAIGLFVLVVLSYLYDQGSKEEEFDDDDMDDIKETEDEEEDKKVTISKEEAQIVNEQEEIDLEPEPVSNQVLPAIAEDEYAPIDTPSTLLNDDKPIRKRGGRKSQKP